MNRIASISTRFLLVILLVGSVVSSSLAGNRIDKTTQKAREAVEQAAPDDWHTLAQSAERCLLKGVNMKEVAVWLDESLAIQETAYNLRLKGDYYMSNQLPEKALACYSKSIRVGKLHDESYMDADTQQKIVSILKQ